MSPYGYKILQIKMCNATRVSTHNIPVTVLESMKAALKKYWKMRNPDYTIIVPADATVEWISNAIQNKLKHITGEVDNV
jgi:hypothetical protein